MMRKMISATMREGSKVEIMAVVLSVTILSVALLMLIVVFQPTISQATITVAHAGSPANAAGIWTYVNTFSNITNQADGDKFIYGEEVSNWSGTFKGVSYDSFTAVLSGCMYPGSMTFEGQIDFFGNVKDKVGTLVILYHGEAIRKDGLWVSGHWSILSGTGDLANLHGEGTFWGLFGCLEYSGQTYFE